LFNNNNNTQGGLRMDDGEVTPADKAVDDERVSLLEDGDSETGVQVERLDKHPRRVGDQRVVDDCRQRLAHPVLPISHLASKPNQLKHGGVVAN